MTNKNKISTNLDYRYQIYGPSGTHKTFRIVKLYNTGASETLRNYEIENVNEKYLAGSIKHDEAKELLESIKQKLYSQDGIKFVELETLPDNLKIAERYWNSVYEHRKHELEDPKSTLAEILRAVKLLGPASLRKSSKQVLQKAIDKNAEGNKQRRAVSKLNQMLRFLDRDFVLEADERSKRTVRYITLEDLPKLLENLDVPSELKTLHEVAFYTGVLLSESFALDPKTYNPGADTIKISKQLDKDGKRKKETWADARDTVVLPEGRDALMRWFQVQKNVPPEVRLNISRITKRAAMRAFKESYKHITFQDLRHSYAIHLLKKGIPIELVADCLGISTWSAKQLYGNFGTSSGAINFITKTLKTTG